MLDYINTNTFRDFADFKIIFEGDFSDSILQRNAIIYCKTDRIPYLFPKLELSNRKYILITHASDFPINERVFNLRPSCIKKWYAENATFNHPDLITIPIGLTPNKGYDKTILDLSWFIDNIELLRKNKKDFETLYCNWTTRNYPSIRSHVLEKLDKNNIRYFWDFKFPNNIDQLIQDKIKEIEQGKSTKEELNKLVRYYEYCENMSKHKFVVSPRGNGEDTHRTWEALYMGCFPIVLKSNIFNEYKDDLPIIQVNDYSEVTYDLLLSYLNKEYNYEKLYMSYWKNRIIKEFKQL